MPGAAADHHRRRRQQQQQQQLNRLSFASEAGDCSLDPDSFAFASVTPERGGSVALRSHGIRLSIPPGALDREQVRIRNIFFKRSYVGK